YAEVKALATGNPLILEKAGIENEIAALQRLARAHRSEQRNLADRQRHAAQRAQRMDTQADSTEAAIRRRVDTRADNFAMTVDGTEHRARVTAGAQLRLALLHLLDTPTPPGTIGR